LVVIFTKFDALIIREYGELGHVTHEQTKQAEARANALKTFQKHYLCQIRTVQNPPRAIVKLEGKAFYCDMS
jgi:hypothetical protein